MGDQDDHDHDGAQDGAGDGRAAHGRGCQDQHVGGAQVPAQEDGDEGGHACHDQRLALRDSTRASKAAIQYMYISHFAVAYHTIEGQYTCIKGSHTVHMYHILLCIPYYCTCTSS